MVFFRFPEPHPLFWVKNFRSLLRGQNADRIPYRKLAHADFKAGIRRNRNEVIAAVTGGR